MALGNAPMSPWYANVGKPLGIKLERAAKMNAIVIKKIFVAFRYIYPALSAISHYIRFYLVSAIFIGLLSPWTGISLQWGPPATLLFVFAIRNKLLKAIASTMSGLFFALSYTEANYNMPLNLIINSNQDLFDILRVIIVPYSLIMTATTASFYIAHRLRLAKVIRKFLNKS